MSALEANARAFAIERHGDQLRKWTGEPYWTHLEEVANIVALVDGTHAQRAAAWLHDTLEDTDTSWEDLANRFGLHTANLVSAVTEVSKLSDGNRAVRKEKDRQHYAVASPEAKTIKLADLISNSVSIIAHAPGFRRTYLREKARLLNVLREGDARLWWRARGMLECAVAVGLLDSADLPAPLAPPIDLGEPAAPAYGAVPA